MVKGASTKRTASKVKDIAKPLPKVKTRAKVEIKATRHAKVLSAPARAFHWTLAMIVKNEASNIASVIASAAPYCKHVCILDTGSTDSTKAEVERACALFDLALSWHGDRFENFSASRNQVLQLAKSELESHPELDPWILMLSGDEYLEPLTTDLELSLKTKLANKHLRVCELQIQHSGISYLSPRLTHAYCAGDYEGITHEAFIHPYKLDQGLATLDLKIEHRVDPNQDMLGVLLRDLEILQGQPRTPRNLYYLGQVLFDLRRLPEAITTFQESFRVTTWEEEAYECLYKIAQSHELLDDDLDIIVGAYLKAYSYRSTRAEPLFAIAWQYHLRNDHPLAFLFAELAWSKDKPEDRLFLHEEVYKWKAADLVAIHAYYVGEHYKGHSAALEALREGPEEQKPRLQKNLSFYELLSASEV